MREDKLIGVFAQRQPSVEEPALADLYPIGTLGIIKKMARSDDVIQIVVQGTRRVQAAAVAQTHPFLSLEIDEVPQPEDSGAEVEALQRAVLELAGKMLQLVQPQIQTSLNHRRPISPMRPARRSWRGRLLCHRPAGRRAEWRDAGQGVGQSNQGGQTGLRDRRAGARQGRAAAAPRRNSWSRRTDGRARRFPKRPNFAYISAARAQQDHDSMRILVVEDDKDLNRQIVRCAGRCRLCRRQGLRRRGGAFPRRYRAL